MNAKVNQRAAAGTGLIAEPAAGVAVSAQILSLCVVDFAKVTFVDIIL